MNFASRQSCLCAGTEITDFQMPDKTSNTIKYLPVILKIHQTSCLVILSIYMASTGNYEGLHANQKMLLFIENLEVTN